MTRLPLNMHIILVEPSPTLRFGLSRLLQKNGYQVSSYNNYEKLYEQIDDLLIAPPQLMVAGWPHRNTLERSHLSSLLMHQDLYKIPAVVFVKDMDETGIDILSNRPQTLVQLWQNYQQCPCVLNKLLQYSETPQMVSEMKGKINVLLVDDSKSVRKIYGNLLQQLDFSVTLAEHAEDAWHIVQKQHFDLAIIDYFMPGENGAMLCRKLSESSQHQHIIKAILTGSYKDSIIEESINAGAVECMFKNESSNLFLSRVNAMAKQVISNRHLATQKSNLESILSSVGDGIYGVDNQGELIFINPAGLKILNYANAQDVLGKKAHELFHHSDERGESISNDTNYLYQAYLLSDTLCNWETVFWTSENNSIHVECTIQPLQKNGEEQGSVVVFKDISERKLIEDELNWQLNHDHLTQLLNRTCFEKHLDKQLTSLKNTENQAALLYIDLDNFKMINDEAGHSAGDQLLVQIGEHIRTRLRHRDLAARLSGDEFAILLSDIKTDSLEKLADSYREVLENIQFIAKGREFPVSGSIGVAILTSQTSNRKLVIDQADFACKIAKQIGKNKVHVFAPEEHDSRLSTLNSGWKSRIEQGLKDNRFKLEYQPIFSLFDLEFDFIKGMSNEAVSQWLSENAKPERFEAFVRLRHDNNQIIKPGAFIGDAERFDLITELDTWVVDSALKELKNTDESIHLSLNLSANTLLDSEATHLILHKLEKNKSLSNRLTIELQEHHLLHYRDKLRNALDKFSEINVKLEVDDFGRNFSLFSKVSELPINGIKVDGLFTKNIAWDPIDRQLVHSMVEVARTSEMTTTAKSVETSEALLVLNEGGIDFVQGHLLSLPMSHLPAKQCVG